MKTIRFLLQMSILASLLLALVACTQNSLTTPSKIPTGTQAARPTPIVTFQPTPSPTPLGGSSTTLGPVPQTCSSNGKLMNISPHYGPALAPAIGDSPVWVGAGNWRIIHNVPSLIWDPPTANANHDQYGWGHKFLWVVATSYQGIVTLRGRNLSDGSPLYPDADTKETASTLTSLVLDTRNPTIPNHYDQWTEFPGNLAIPRAGCYSLEATWLGGSWRVTFAAGEVPS